MTLPIVSVERPLDLIGADNGRLDPALLVPVGPSGLLHHLAARSWYALHAAASTAGFSLTYSYGGTYRTYSQQEQLFRQRYTLTVLTGRPTKQWQGQTWYQMPNTAMAAVPGTSNHGLGLAVDTGIGSDPAHVTSITPRIDWMAANAPLYGWSWETLSEPWHVRLVTGDRIPTAVLAYENPTPAPSPAPTPDPQPSDGETDMYLIKAANGDPAVYLVIPTPRLPTGRARVHVTAAQWDAINLAYGPLCTVTDPAAYGPIIGA